MSTTAYAEIAADAMRAMAQSMVWASMMHEPVDDFTRERRSRTTRQYLGEAREAIDKLLSLTLTEDLKASVAHESQAATGPGYEAVDDNGRPRAGNPGCAEVRR